MVEGILTPILVAAGGGGLGYNASTNIYPNGRSMNMSIEANSGSTQPWGAGQSISFNSYCDLVVIFGANIQHDMTQVEGSVPKLSHVNFFCFTF
jgi:hypothetical protein